MSITPLIGVPGIGSVRTASYKTVMRSMDRARYYPGGGVIDGTKARNPDNSPDNTLLLQPGLLMGKVTSSKMWAPSLLGVTQTAALASTDTSLTLTAAVAAELVRRIGTSGTFKLTGPPTANGVVRTVTVTYSAVNTTTGVVTITAIGVNEVQTVGVDTIVSGGKIDVQAVKSDGTVQTVNVAYNTSWTQTVADIQTALIAVLGTSAVACAVANTHDMTITFSGTGYAALPQTLVVVDVSAATGPTKASVTRTTAGVDGRFVVGSFVGDTDGSQTPRSFVPDGTGLLVPGDSSNFYFEQIPIAGDVQASQVINWPSDTSLRQWVIDSLNANGYGKFTFDSVWV